MDTYSFRAFWPMLTLISVISDNYQSILSPSAGDKVLRGCLSRLDAAHKKRCLSNSKACKSCSTSNCNGRQTMPECYVSQPDGDFLHMEPQHSTRCTDYNDTCFVHIVGDKVFRGCFNDYTRYRQLGDNFLADNANSVLFKRCDDYKCNGDVVKQAACIKCDSNDDPNCHNAGADMVQTCAVSVDSTACYHYSDGDRVIRGCMAEVRPEHRQSCANNSDQCKMCAGNGCNGRSHFQRCRSCDADRDC